jgi:hypothetical protein
MRNKKRGRIVNIKINFSNRWLYFLVTLGILIVVAIGVYAYTSPNGIGHDITEIEPCADGQVLVTNDEGIWTCANLKSWSYSGWFTTYTYCSTICRDHGYECFAAQQTSDGTWTSCVSGSSAEKRCFCIKIFAE